MILTEALEVSYEGIQGNDVAFDNEYSQQKASTGAPKFPRPSEILFLFRFREFCEHDKTNEIDPAEISKMALHTLQMMGKGGINDHIGGGFHR